MPEVQRVSSLLPFPLVNVDGKDVRRDTEVVQSVSRRVMHAMAATAKLALATLVRLSTRRFSCLEQHHPGMETNGRDTLPRAAVSVGVPASSRFFDKRGGGTAAPPRLAVDTEASEGSFGDGASAILRWLSTRSFPELRQARLPIAAGAHELAECSSEEDDLELWRAERAGDLPRHFLHPRLVQLKGPIAAGSGNGGPYGKSNLAALSGELNLTNFGSRRPAALADVPVAPRFGDGTVFGSALGRPPPTRAV